MQFDLVVVGGGHNGLVCAAYAAAAGLSTLVLEAHERVGGAAFTEEFHPGFRNSAASYTVSLLEPTIIRDLNLGKHGLRIVPRPLENFVPALSGPGLEFSAEPAESAASIRRLCPSDAESYGRYRAALDGVVELVRPLWLDPPVEPLAGRREFARALRVLGGALRSGPRVLANAVKLLQRSAGDWLDAHFESDLVKGALGFDSIVGHFASPYAASSGYYLLHHAFGQTLDRHGSWGHAIGGMGAISDAIACAARARGVEIRTGEPVRSAGPSGSGFVVETPGGEYRCKRLASAVHPQRFFLELLRDVDLPDAFRQRIAGWQSESASFRMNVALSELPDFRCLPGRHVQRHHGAGILITPSLAYLARAHQDALQDGMSAQPVVELVIPSVIDPTLAPEGAHVASLFCQHFRYLLPDGRSWRSERDTAVEAVIATVDAYAPNFRRSIVGLKAYSPLDLERRFGLVGGDIFHGAMIPGQLYHERPARRFARYRAPVPNVYLCASGAHPGGGVSGIPGRNAARAIIEDARAVGSRTPSRLFDDGDRDPFGPDGRLMRDV